MFAVRRDDLSGAQTQALIALHIAGMNADSPPGAIFALDLSGLREPGVTVWTAWAGEAVASIGALKMLADGNAEVKSMRTHPDFLRMGAAALILDTIVAAAARKGAKRISLETGSGAAFDPALTLYRRYGFEIGEPFAEYRQSEFGQFLHRNLD